MDINENLSDDTQLTGNEERYFKDFLRSNLLGESTPAENIKTIPGRLTPKELVGVMLPLALDYVKMTESMVDVQMDKDVIAKYPALIMPEPYYLGFNIEFITDYIDLAMHADLNRQAPWKFNTTICDYDCSKMSLINPFQQIPMLSINSWLANCELDLCPLTMSRKMYINQLKPLTPSFIKELFNWHKRVVMSGDITTEEGEVNQEKVMIKIFGKNTPFNHPYFPRHIYRVYLERNFANENQSNISIEDIEELICTKKIVKAVMYPDKGFLSTGDHSLDTALRNIWSLFQGKNINTNVYYALLPGKEEPQRNGRYVNISEV